MERLVRHLRRQARPVVCYDQRRTEKQKNKRKREKTKEKGIMTRKDPPPSNNQEDLLPSWTKELEAVLSGKKPAEDVANHGVKELNRALLRCAAIKTQKSGSLEQE